MKILKGCGIALVTAVLTVVACFWILYNVPGCGNTPKNGALVAKGALNVDWAQDGKSVYFTLPRDDFQRNTVYRYNVESLRAERLSSLIEAQCCSVSPDGRYAVCSQEQGRVIVADLAKGATQTIFTAPGRVKAVHWLRQDLILVSIDETDLGYRPPKLNGSIHIMRPDGSGERKIARGYSRMECFACDGSGLIYIVRYDKEGTQTSAYRYYDLEAYVDRPGEFIAAEKAEQRYLDAQQDVLYLSRTHVIYRSRSQITGSSDDEIRVRDLRTMEMHVLPFPGIFSAYGSGSTAKEANIDSISPNLSHYVVTVQRGFGEFAPLPQLWLVKVPEVTRKRLQQLGVQSR